MTQQTLERPATGPNTGSNAAVALYATHLQAEAAVKALQKSGLDMKKLSIVGNDYHTEEHVVGFYNTGDRMMAWGKRGAFWGSIWGLLFWGGLFVIPGVGPILLAGPLVAAIVGALEGAVVIGGMSALGAALVGLGVPANSALSYETEIRAGRFLLVVHGTPAEIAATRAILEMTEHEGLSEHAV